MRGWVRLRGLLILGLLLPLLAGCGGGDSHPPIVVEPGLVGIDDRPNVSLTAPELTVEYALPGGSRSFVTLLSDQPTDGDIAFDPVRGSYTITQGPDTLLFGIDSADPNEPEYRAFLDFPLDGSTGQAVIPLNATILSANLTVFVNFVDFAFTVPVLLDLVEYSVTGLAPGDFSSAPLAVRAFDIDRADVSRDVVINVTPLMVEAQRLGLADLQLRFLLGP
jgi:hypothetical protein